MSHADQQAHLSHSDSTANWHQRRASATPKAVGVMCPFYVEKAENSYLWDIDGKRYIDFAGGIAVLNTGHRHPKIQAAIQAQLDQFVHTAYQITPYTEYIRLAERINQCAPIDGMAKSVFFTTGAEAVENAVKIARHATQRQGIIAFNGSFHGRTQLGMALTGKVLPYKSGFGVAPPAIYHVPYPTELHDITVDESIKAIHNLFKCDIAPNNVAAIILEPVQGEGGFYAAPPELMNRLRSLCDEHGILLIADEVQTGFGRTGKLFAMEHHQVKADLITIAKSLAGGMPLSGVVGRADIMDSPNPGGLGGTYAGNPLSIASAHAVLDVIAEEKLVERSQKLGEKLLSKLQGLQKKHPEIAEVRGLGSMVAIEFNDKHGQPSAAITSKVQSLSMDHGLMLLTCGVYGNVIRFLYPLTIPDHVFDDALAILETSIQQAV